VVIGDAALKRSVAQRGRRGGLDGFGASASLAGQVARSGGWEIYVATRAERGRARALVMGATWAGGAIERPPVPLHAAVTFAPVGSVVIAALQALDRGGTVAINAIHLDQIPAFDYDVLRWARLIT